MATIPTNSNAVDIFLNELKVYVEKNNGKEEPEVLATKARDFSDNFILTGTQVDALQESKYNGSLSITFNDAIGNIKLRDLNNVKNLRFVYNSNDDGVSNKDSLHVTLENVIADYVGFIDIANNNFSFNVQNCVISKFEMRRSCIYGSSISQSIVHNLHIAESDIVYSPSINDKLAMALTNTVLGKIEFNAIKTVYNKIEGKGEIQIENCFIEKAFEIEKCPSLGRLKLSMTIPQLDNWWKVQTKIPYEALLQNIGTIQKLKLLNTKLRDLQISGCKVNELSIIDSSVSETVNINKGSTLGQFVFKVDKPAKGCSYDIGSFIIDNATAEMFNLKGSDCNAIAKIKFTNAFIKKGIIDEIVKTKISLEDLLVSDSFLQVTNTVVDSISFKNFTNQGVINLINVQREGSNKVDTDEMRLKKSNNNSSDDKPMLEIINANLGKTHFYGCKFGTSIVYTNSSIIEIALLNTTFPWRVKELDTSDNEEKNKQSSESSDKQSPESSDKQSSESSDTQPPELSDKQSPELNAQQSSLLGQLRRVYELNNNVANAIASNAYQLDTIYKQSQLGWEKAALWLNKITNFYGYDLKQAVKTTFWVSIISYLLYGWARGYITCGALNLDYMKYMASNFFEFISPVRRTNILMPAEEFYNSEWDPSSEKIDNFTMIISGFSRIVVSYIFVQFVLAFRKYGRKA